MQGIVEKVLDKEVNPQITSEQIADRLALLDIISLLGEGSRGTNPDAVALTVSRFFAKNRQEETLTYRELYDGVARMAAGYRSLGLGRGSKIGLAETNSLDFFSSYFGGLAIGATMVPINLLALQDESSKTKRLVHMLATPRLSPQDVAGVDAFVFGNDPLFEKMYSLGNVLKLSRNPLIRTLVRPSIQRFANGSSPQSLIDRILFKTLSKKARTPQERQNLLLMFEGLPRHMKIITPEGKRQLMASAPLPPAQMVTPPDDDIADILYTSGTSGNPKGVALTHRNLAFTVKSLTEGTVDVIGDGDVVLMGLPFFHIFGKTVMLTCLSRHLHVSQHGGKVNMVLLPSLSKAVLNLDGVIKTIDEYKVTVLPAVPVFLEKLVEYLNLHPHKKSQVQSLKIIISGGAALKRETFDALKEINPSLVIMEGYGSSEGGINLLNKPGYPGYVGSPLPGVSTRLVRTSENSDRGELLVRSDGVSRGYVVGTTDSSDLTIADEEGWFRTGDIVRFDAEKQFQIIGRESFFIKIDNEKRSPEELEDAVRLVSPEITNIMVVSHLAGTIHEMAVAVVVTENPHWTESSIKKAMFDLARQNQINRWKIPRHMLVLHQPRLPARFDNEFKREAGYKFVREFVKEVLNTPGRQGEPIVIFHHSDNPREAATEIRDEAGFQAIVNQYNNGFQSDPKKEYGQYKSTILVKS